MIRRFLLFLLVVLAPLSALGQATGPGYLLPKPLPTQGPLPPTAFLVKPGGAYAGMTAYEDAYPAGFDVLTTGGWRSVGTTTERDAILMKYRKEGMSVYVAANSSVYVLKPDLANWWNLSELVLGTAGESFYTTNGSLSSPRTVNGAGFGLTWTNMVAFSVNASQITLNAPLGFRLGTQSAISGAAQQGWVLTYQANGNADFQPSPGIVNIYTQDGGLQGDRQVSMDAHELKFRGPGQYKLESVDALDVQSTGPITLNASSTATLRGPQAVNLVTKGIINRTAVNGQVLSLIDSTNGTVEWATGGGSNTFTDTSIYVNDGTLLTNRVLRGAGFNLSFTNVGTLDMRGTSVGIYGSSGLVVGTPNVVNKTAQAGQVLTFMNPVTGTAEFQTAPLASNIYNASGVLTSDRILEGGAHDLSFTNLKHLDMRGWTSTVAGTQKFELITPNVANGTAATNQVLTLLDKTTGRSEYASLPPDISIYTTNGTLSGERTVTHGTNKLTFDATGGSWHVFNANTVGIGAFTNQIYGRDSLWLSTAAPLKYTTPRVQSSQVNAGDVLMITSVAGSTNAFVDFYTPTNIYNANGKLTADRTVTGNGNSLLFTGLNNFGATGLNTDLEGTGRLSLHTPGFSNAVPGQVLTLMDKTSGATEFQDPPNIYNKDGQLTTNRLVTLGPHDLTFDATAGRFIVFNANTVSMDAKTNMIYGREELWLTSSKDVKFTTPSVNAQTAAIGDVLAVRSINPSNAIVDFIPPPNLYTTNGTLAGDRTANLNFRDLSFTNGKVLSMLGQTSILSGTLELDVRTPNVVGGTSATNRVLTLLDKTTGRSEFMDLPGFTNIYVRDGAITGNRSITIPSGMYLRTIGPGTFILNSAINNINAGENYLVSSDLAQISANTRLQVKSPRFWNGQAKDGDVLTMVNRAAGTGETDFYPPNNIYNTNGTVTSHRTVTCGPFNMVFDGTSVFQAKGNWLRLYSGITGDFVISTPKIAGSGAQPPATAGNVLTLKDALTGRAEWEPAPGGGTGSGDYSSIYANDGALVTNLVGTPGTRTLNVNGKRLVFSETGYALGSGGAFDISLPNGRFSVNALTNDFFAGTGGTVRLGGGGSTIIQTPGTFANPAARTGMFLQWDGSKSEYASVNAGADTSIYNTNGTLLGHRVLTGGNLDMTWTGIRNLSFTNTTAMDMRSVTTTLGGSTALNLRTPNVASATIGQVPTIIASDGTGAVNFATPTNIYNADGKMTGYRSVDGNNNGFMFANFQVATFDSTGLVLKGRNALDIYTPNLVNNPGLVDNGMVLTLTDKSLGYVEYQPVNSIYTVDAPLTGALATRTVTLNNKTLIFQGGGNVSYTGLGTFDVNSATRSSLQSSGEVTISANGSLKINPPGGGAVNQVLTYQSDGTAKWQPVGSSVNIYNTSSGLVGVEATRQVDLNNKTLRFQGGGNIDSTGIGTFTVSASGNSTLQTDGTLTLGGKTVGQNALVKIRTGNVVSNMSTIGQVLTLHATDGTVEYKSSTDVSGIIEYYGDAVGQFNNTEAHFTLANTNDVTVSPAAPALNPAYTQNVEPNDMTRATFRLRRKGGTNGGIVGGFACNITFGAYTTARPLVDPVGNNLQDCDYRDGSIVEAIYNKSKHYWVSLNFGAGGPGVQGCWAAGPLLTEDELETKRAELVTRIVKSSPSKVTTAERLLLNKHVDEGTMVYDTVLHKMMIYTGTEWRALNY